MRTRKITIFKKGTIEIARFETRYSLTPIHVGETVQLGSSLYRVRNVLHIPKKNTRIIEMSFEMTMV